MQMFSISDSRIVCWCMCCWICLL